MNDSTADRWQRLDTLLAEAFARDPDERTAYLRAACGADHRLYEEVLALLGHADAAARALGESAAAFAAPLLAGEGPLVGLRPGDRVGPYRIEGERGRGGMGVVYRATRADGAFRKAVALKLVKRGMDTDEVLARFRRERQVLAGLDHPGIARLLDGGAADDGRPYLVMEYVEGEPITAYADRKRLGVGARLALMERVCEAVQHAHRRLVVHRDLKPSNVLVADDEAGDPQVKLLDFGIAKLLEEGEDEAVTRTEARRLTPAYAAPEQGRGEAATAATDVYALGVILYELLAGQRPAAPPRPPGAAVTAGAAEAQGTTPERLRRWLRGDLDTLVLKALREEPEARYPSVESLLADLRRHREGLPIHARPASVGYRVRKFVARHRAGVAAAVAFGLVLVVAVVALALQQRQTARERDRAEAAARRAERSNDLMTGLFEASNVAGASGDTLTAHALVERAVGRIGAFEDDPVMQAELHGLVGRLYYTLGDYPAARRHLEEAVDRWRALYGEDHPRVADALFDLGTVLHLVGRYGAADSLYERWIATTARVPPQRDEDYAARLLQLGRARMFAPDVGEAERYLVEAEALSRRLRGPRHPNVAQAQRYLAYVYQRRGELLRAEALLREAIGTFRHAARETGEGPAALFQEYAPSLFELGDVLKDLGRPEEAESYLREAIESYGEGHYSHPLIVAKLGEVLRDQGRYGEAERLLGAAVERLEARHGAEAPIALRVQGHLAELYCRQGRYAEAERLLLDSYEGLAARTGARYVALAREEAERLAGLYEAWGRPGDAARFAALSRGAEADGGTTAP